MRAWYCPSWNGDWRLEQDPESAERTRLSVVKPTPAELIQLQRLGPIFVERKWLSESDGAKIQKKPGLFRGDKHHVTLAAPLAEVGALVTSNLKPGPAVLTAVIFRDGHVEIVESKQSAALLPEPAAPASTPAEPSADDATLERLRQEKKAADAAEAAAKAVAAKKDAEVAATVKRPTPCCPDCYVDAVGPATDVLLSFLSEEQHETWKRHRFLVVRGGITGHRYLIAHRKTPLAVTQRRIAFDLEDREVMHFHDWTVPPEEEVLAAMLILRHREPWLRNEATALGNHRFKFKNPFGGCGDGVVDSLWTSAFGATAERWFG